MRILLVAATELETAWLREVMGFYREGSLFVSDYRGRRIDLLHTGIGMVNTAFHLGKYLAIHSPGMAVNLGIAGSFDYSRRLGSVVEVVSDTFSELGADTPDKFLDIQAMGFPLMEHNGKLWFNRLENPAPSTLDIPQVKGITVNTVHGNPASIALTRKQWNPDIETMEGAAFFHAMIHSEIPFFAFRGISNYVELRDRSKWQIALAAEQVQRFIKKEVL
ncbi:MAG: futalosine hydrolase [Bacteroidia bacterium]|nr:futalosine hydrolase [Bacteroidia bacterium]